MSTAWCPEPLLSAVRSRASWVSSMHGGALQALKRDLGFKPKTAVLDLSLHAHFLRLDHRHSPALSLALLIILGLLPRRQPQPFQAVEILAWTPLPRTGGIQRGTHSPVIYSTLLTKGSTSQMYLWCLSCVFILPSAPGGSPPLPACLWRCTPPSEPSWCCSGL